MFHHEHHVHHVSLKIPQERLLFERIGEQIGDILVLPTVEETS